MAQTTRIEKVDNQTHPWGRIVGSEIMTGARLARPGFGGLGSLFTKTASAITGSVKYT